MTRTLRTLLNSLTTLSSLLLLTLLVFWPLSYSRGDSIQYVSYDPSDKRHHYFRLDLGQGGAALLFASTTPQVRIDWGSIGWSRRSYTRRPIAYPSYWRTNPLGFHHHLLPGPEFRRRIIIFPLWPCAALLALPPAARLARHRRIPAGHCPRCRYDLRATPHRCPECGANYTKEFV